MKPIIAILLIAFATCELAKEKVNLMQSEGTLKRLVKRH